MAAVVEARASPPGSKPKYAKYDRVVAGETNVVMDH
jgi:hypothetical protein